MNEAVGGSQDLNLKGQLLGMRKIFNWLLQILSIIFYLYPDIESPSFGSTCPTGILATADEGKNYTEPSWPPVVATDNSGIKPVVTTVGIRAKYYEGKHLIVYNAIDATENRKLCRFYLSVESK